MILMEPFESRRWHQQVAIHTDEPMRIEITNVNGYMTVYGYRGFGVDKDQEPDLVFQPEIDDAVGFMEV